MGTATQLITAVNLLLGNAWDSTGASCLVEQSQASVETLVVAAGAGGCADMWRHQLLRDEEPRQRVWVWGIKGALRPDPSPSSVEVGVGVGRPYSE